MVLLPLLSLPLSSAKVAHDGRSPVQFNQANAICLLTVKKEISGLATEKKVVPIYDFKERKEVPTEVNMIPALVGEKFIAGILRQIVDKNEWSDSAIVSEAAWSNAGTCSCIRPTATSPRR